MDSGANVEDAVVVSTGEGIPVVGKEVEDAETGGAVSGDLGEVEMVACGCGGFVGGAEKEGAAGLEWIARGGCFVVGGGSPEI